MCQKKDKKNRWEMVGSIWNKVEIHIEIRIVLTKFTLWNERNIWSVSSVSLSFYLPSHALRSSCISLSPDICFTASRSLQKKRKRKRCNERSSAALWLITLLHLNWQNDNTSGIRHIPADVCVCAHVRARVAKLVAHRNSPGGSHNRLWLPPGIQTVIVLFIE